MNQIIIAFITGLTTGGLSCLAVQGGLLASSLAHQIEKDLQATDLPRKGSFQGSVIENAKPQPNTALPIALFLLAKLVAYTLLGALLGFAGSFFTFDPTIRAILLTAIGVFMVGNALRMFNVHPIFRYFNIEPPKFITRYIRRTAKNGTELFIPLFLGALTLFIPCGVTQAMMAAALGTGNPAIGAAMMFAFILGTSPVFFLVAFFATKIGYGLEKYFMRFVAIVVLILGLVSVNSALNLMGSPLAPAIIGRSMFDHPETPSITPTTSTESSYMLQLDVKNNGYFPKTLHAKANQAISLSLVTNNTVSCARDFVIPVLKYYKLLPQTGVISVDIPPQAPGTIMAFSCSMGMYTGQIVFDN
jgi:sulfite exporter TauE/SafE